VKMPPWGFAWLVVSGSVLAGASPMQPGQWDYSIKTEMPGVPFPMPPISYSHCLTADDVSKGSVASDPNQKGDCKTQNLKQAGSRISYDFVCTGEHPVKGHYEFDVTATTLAGTGSMDLGGGQQMTQKLSAKRKGDCAR
jgi:hypothetical protein